MATVTRSERDDKRPVTSEILDRQPPRSLESERAVLGSILLLPDVADDVALLLRPDDFYDQAHQTLYQHMMAMHDAGRRVDSTLLVESLKASGQFESIGGAPLIAEVARSVPTAAHAEYYAEQVREKAMIRSLIHSSTEILRDAYDETVVPREMLGRAEERIFAILEQRGTGQLASIREVLQESLVRLDNRMQHDHSLTGVETGFVDLDQLIGGLQNSELIILAGRPSMGKTALALNVAEHAAMQANVPTLFVSLEMSSVELADRMMCSIAEVDSSKHRSGTISREDRTKIVATANDLSQAPLFVDDSPSRTMTEIAAAARRLKRREQLGLIVIDYLQLIDPDNSKDPRQEQVAKIARRLKGLARELDVPLMCLAQLNRQAEETRDHRPRLSHLRESGAIEQDADVVMFVHREEYYLSSDEQERLRMEGDRDILGNADVIIAKNRNGPVGDIHLLWFQQFTRFRNKAPQPYADMEVPAPSYEGDF